MYNLIHGVNFRMDQHTSEPILPGACWFKIPVFDTRGTVEWKGCYTTPNTALAGIKSYSDTKKLSQEKHNELCDIFQASLILLESKIPENLKGTHFTVKAAPAHHSLKAFGGNDTFEQYRAKYDEHFIMDKIYAQKITSTVENTSGAVGDMKKWNLTVIPTVGAANEEFLQKLECNQTDVPRNIANVIEALVAFYDAIQGKNDGSTNSIVVYRNPDKKNVFGIGAPQDFETLVVNKLGHKLLGNQNVYGEVVLFSKRPLSLSKKRASPNSKKEKGKQESNEAADKVADLDENLQNDKNALEAGAKKRREQIISQKQSKDKETAMPPPTKKQKMN